MNGCTGLDGGMNRSGPDSYHTPVLLEETVQFWLGDPSGTYLEGMIGGGGHTEAMLSRLTKKGRIIGLDCDADAVAACKKRFAGEPRVQVIRGHFRDAGSMLGGLGIPAIDGMFLDTGISGFQVDCPEKGFSYLHDGPLDLRMDRDSSLTASTVVNSWTEKALADLFYTYGEERLSRRIARRIVEERAKAPIETTGRLSQTVGRAVPAKWRVKSLARVWQALRWSVTGELEELREGLMGCYPLLKENAAVVVISYESITDRMVKRFFRGELPAGLKDEPVGPSGYGFEVVTRHVVVPSWEEMKRNPRSRSARLRCARKRMEQGGKT